MEQRRVLAIRAAGFGPGSGYLVGERLALTSAHVVGPVGTSVRVFRPGAPTVFDAVVAWRGTPGDRDDAALLVLDERCGIPPGAGSVRWGRTVTFCPGAAWRTWGRPDAVQAAEAAVEVAQPYGTLSPGDGLVADRYILDISGALPEDGSHDKSPWGGLSGAAVFCGNLLVGVVAGAPKGWGNRKLTAVPAYVLHACEGFTTVLAAYGTRSPLEPVEFQDITEPARVARPDETVPSAAGLLEARRAVVPFYGRENVLNQMAEWARLPGPTSVWLLHASGGQGKTRLAQQLSAILAADKWVTVWIRTDTDPKALAVLEHTAREMLVVLDYTESYPRHLAALLTTLAARSTGAAVRVLLLARTDSWWRDAADTVSAARNLIASATVTELGALDADEQSRRTGYRSALTAFAAAMPSVAGQQDPDWPCIAAALVTPRFPARVSALSVHMAALADLLDATRSGSADQDSAGEAGAWEVEDRLLWHEKGYWYRTAAAHRATSELSELTLREAIAATVLCSPVTHKQADALLAQVPGLADQGYDRRRAVRLWISSLYPPSVPGTPWNGLQPDRLAEHFVGRHLLEEPAIADVLASNADTAQAEHLLSVYARAAAHTAFTNALDPNLVALTVRHCDVLAPVAVQVATRVVRPAPLLNALWQIVDDPGTGPDQLARLADCLPHASQTLADWAAHLNTRLIEKLRSLVTNDPGTYLPDLAGSLNNRAYRLADLGRWEEAADAIREAIDIDRRLAQDHPDTYLPGLAISLTTSAQISGHLGQKNQQAGSILEAVGIYQRLAADHPAEFVADLAASLNNLSLTLVNLGLWERALDTSGKAVYVFSELNDESPDAFAADLAASLHNHALALVGLRRREQALEVIFKAVEIRRRLAEDRPDAFLADLAASLYVLAANLADLGQREQAMTEIRTAIDIYSDAAATNPAAYQTQLDLSLRLLHWLQDEEEDDKRLG